METRSIVRHDIPASLRTLRLLLRAWTPADAEALEPVLAENTARLKEWIPARVAEWAPVEALRERLAAYAADFADGLAFRYAIFSTTELPRLLGGADLHPRIANGRVPIAEADGVELGYWLAKSAEGQGFAIEAARALLDVARTVRTFTYVEARVDPRNARSAAVARRLGLTCSRAERGLEIWQSATAKRPR